MCTRTATLATYIWVPVKHEKERPSLLGGSFFAHGDIHWTEGVYAVEWSESCPKEAVWRKAPNGWSWVNCPGRLLAEESLQRLLRETDWGLVKRDQEGFFLAFLCMPEGMFLLPPLFCLARIVRLEGRLYQVFRFSRRGWAEPMYRIPSEGDTGSES